MIEVEIDGQVHQVPSVEELKEAGFRIRIRHLRFVDENLAPLWVYGKRPYKPNKAEPVQRRYGLPVAVHGGETHALILSPNKRWGEGWVKCSQSDPYVRRVGYVLAVERALADLGADWPRIYEPTP